MVSRRGRQARWENVDMSIVERLAGRAQIAAAELALATRAVKDTALNAMADDLIAATDQILAANVIDVEAARADGTPLRDDALFRPEVRKAYADLAVAMGGRVAEEEIFGYEKVTSGASADIKMATGLARAMATECGMSDKLGPLLYGDNQDEVFLGRSMVSRQVHMSDETQQVVDALAVVVIGVVALALLSTHLGLDGTVESGVDRRDLVFECHQLFSLLGASSFAGKVLRMSSCTVMFLARPFCWSEIIAPPDEVNLRNRQYLPVGICFTHPCRLIM